jgi:hypothetical protein
MTFGKIEAWLNKRWEEGMLLSWERYVLVALFLAVHFVKMKLKE